MPRPSPSSTSTPKSSTVPHVFRSSRVPIENLFDYLKSGESMDFFLEDFDGVRREQVIKVLEMSHKLLEASSSILRVNIA